MNSIANRIEKSLSKTGMNESSASIHSQSSNCSRVSTQALFPANPSICNSEIAPNPPSSTRSSKRSSRSIKNLAAPVYSVYASTSFYTSTPAPSVREDTASTVASSTSTSKKISEPTPRSMAKEMVVPFYGVFASTSWYSSTKKTKQEKTKKSQFAGSFPDLTGCC